MKQYLAYYFSILLLLAIFIQGQAQVTVKGKVLDENGEPLPGAAILAKGVELMLLTNDSGEFTARLFSETDELLISCRGYKVHSIALQGKDLEVEVQMLPVSPRNRFWRRIWYFIKFW